MSTSYGTVPTLVHRGVGADDVVVGKDVRVAELLDPLRVRAHGADVGADLGLGEHDTDLHHGLLRRGGPAAVWWVSGGSTAHSGAASQCSANTNSRIGRRRTGPCDPSGPPDGDRRGHEHALGDPEQLAQLGSRPRSGIR